MKLLLSFFVFTLFAFSGYSQNWFTNFEEAKAIAVKEGKPILLVFQGSDWCAPCIKLDREIWSTDVFKNYARAHYVMVQLDFPRRKKNALPKAQAEVNGKLFEIYNRNGIFPFVAILNSQGELLGEKSYKKTTVEKYINEINNFLQP
ncbi:MAG: thioredoxin family protein [Wenyingzhuangia sp.]|jgi:thioredoxin-related protein|uniref:thioredoxin family protein n=1 Tax=Wenyingzhuangia sp. TaxID=1964193 RepID=UPI00321C060F